MSVTTVPPWLPDESRNNHVVDRGISQNLLEPTYILIELPKFRWTKVTNSDQTGEILSGNQSTIPGMEGGDGLLR